MRKLFENPDELKYKNLWLHAGDYDSYVFGYAKEDMQLFDIKRKHKQSYKKGDFWMCNGTTHVDTDEFAGNRKDINRNDFEYAGRLWLNSKVISFWFYPPKEKLFEMLKDLENNLKIRINPAKWKIEIVKGEIEYKDSGWMGSSWDQDSILIPISEYIGSVERDEEDLKTQHTLSPLLKTTKSHWGHKKLKGQLPGELEVKARARMFQEKYGQNMKTTFREFIKENVQDEIGFGAGAAFANDAGEKFWGNLAAGVLPICAATKRILLAFRSKWVNEPHTWGLFGGKLDEEVQGDDDLSQVALREFQEESEFDGNIELIPVYVFRKPNFEYHNFLGIVDEEFEPKLDWETEDTRWVTLDEFMQIYPKHFGLKDLIKNDLEKIKSYVS